jgi:hypothetical protein
LASQKSFPWNDDIKETGRLRAKAAINELAPLLFPIITQAEIKLTGTRDLPIKHIAKTYQFREADRYEIKGIVDVLTSVSLKNPDHAKNDLVRLILDNIEGATPSDFEIIIDYKGMRRPPFKEEKKRNISFWDVYNWQLQTYAHLRRSQHDSLPIKAGVIVYLNELLPQVEDMDKMKKEIIEKRTDVRPDVGSNADQLIKDWNRKKPVPALPYYFRLKRAIRVLDVTDDTIIDALDRFDKVVGRIETCRGKEQYNGALMTEWEINPEDYDTCNACDARTFCPSFTKETSPRLPGVR